MKGGHLLLLVVLSVGFVWGDERPDCKEKDLTKFCDCFGLDENDPAQRYDMMSRKCKMAFYSKCKKINDKSDYLQYPYHLELFTGGNKGCPPPLPCSVVDLAFSMPTTRGSKLYQVAQTNECQAVVNYLPDRHYFAAQQKEQISLAITFLRAYLSLNYGIQYQCQPLSPQPPQPDVDAKCVQQNGDPKPNGNFGIGDCRQFVTCSNGNADVLTCPAGTFFDGAVNSCEFTPFPGCNSDGGASNNGGDDDDSGDDDDDTGNWVSSVAGRCNGKADGNYAYPENCAKFLQCVDNRAYLTACVSGTFYDAKYDTCNGVMVDGCDSSGSDNGGDTDSGEYPTVEQDPNYCEDNSKADGNYPFGDCSNFVTCSSGLTYYTACQKDLFFDDTQNACVWWENHHGHCPSRV